MPTLAHASPAAQPRAAAPHVRKTNETVLTSGTSRQSVRMATFPLRHAAALACTLALPGLLFPDTALSASLGPTAARGATRWGRKKNVPNPLAFECYVDERERGPVYRKFGCSSDFSKESEHFLRYRRFAYEAHHTLALEDTRGVTPSAISLRLVLLHSMLNIPT